METVERYLKNTIQVKERLANEKDYLAHLPSTDTSSKAETLAEHLELVCKYFSDLVKQNGLDETINKLIINIVSEAGLNKKGEIESLIKQLFVDNIVFHDFGKVNENFQLDRMQNRQFKIVDTPIKPAYGHSELGAFIYCVYHVEKLKELFLEDEEINFLAVITFLFANSINLHHCPELMEPFSRFSKSAFIEQHVALTKYLDLFSFEKPDLTSDYFKNLEGAFDSVQFSSLQSFSLFALTKLNFSLLTAADYLATSEYMNGLPISNFGLIVDSVRGKIFKAARSSKSFNKTAYELADSNFTITNPAERNADNLNIIRQNMAVEVIRSTRLNFKERLFYLEAPTGGGKTNLSMLAVSELLNAHSEINKVFYVFPFTTLITQTHKVIVETFELNDNDISLLHSKVGFQVSKEDDDYGSKKKDYLNNLFVHYPFCLLTHIRFFDILKTNEKETNYILHRLANSIVVIDELQSYPPQHWDKMLYFIRQFAEPFNMRFILMSATLPRIDKLNLPLTHGSPFTDLLVNAKTYFSNPNFCERVKFRFEYRNTTMEMNELAKLVIEKSKAFIEEHNKEGIYTIIEFIFKKSTTEFSEAINGLFFDKIFVLSGTILESRRNEIIHFLKNKNNRSRKVLLITTQVVEAGVDIDMDLGFKNVSLIDSDEQLAGRVNRNVLNETGEVYLFQINQPAHLYSHDERYIITRDFLTSELHEEILRTKNFEKLYSLVLARIDKINSRKELQNFISDYLTQFHYLDYREIHRKFKLIEQDTFSIFIPINLPKTFISSSGGAEENFNQSELDFLVQWGLDDQESYISGESVWKIYKAILTNRKIDYTSQKIEKKFISGILSKFTISIFSTEKIRKDLKKFCFPAEDGDNMLRGFDNYIYLAHHSECYDYEKGLLEDRFNNSEGFII